MQRWLLILLLANLALSGVLLWRSFPLPSENPKVEEGFIWPEIEPDSVVSYTYRAELVRVIDGDTVVLDIDLGFETWLRNQVVRLYGLNTPEIRGKEKPEGLEVKAWMEERLYGREIVLQSIQDKKGSFGRWLGILFADGENVNEELLEAKLATELP